MKINKIWGRDLGFSSAFLTVAYGVATHNKNNLYTTYEPNI